MIVQIRGTNGSGKSYAARGVINSGEFGRTYTFDEFQTEITEMGYDPMPGTWENYAAKPGEVMFTYCMVDACNVAVVGRYDIPTGGCDGIHLQDHITNRVRALAPYMGVVLFEGVLAGHTYQRYADLFNDLKQYGPCVIAYLDTPFETCVASIHERRKTSKVVRKPFNVQIMQDKWGAIIRTREKFTEAGYDVRTLPRETSVQTILSWIESEQV